MMKIPRLKFAGNKKLSRKAQKRVWILIIAKLGFKDLKPGDKVNKAKHIIKAMTGNPHFPSPIPSLADVDIAADALDNAQIALDGSKLKTVQRNAAEAILDSLMSSLQGYVDAASRQDKAKILSAGFDVRDPRTKPAILACPTELGASSTKMEGEVKLDWKAIKKKNFYIVEAAQAIEGSTYKIVAQPTKSSVVVSGLVPGERYRFRISVVNGAGASAPSEEIVCRTTQY
jgi:hypothetical protein